MSIIYSFVACLEIFALFHFYCIPLVERRFVLDRSSAAIGRSALMSVLGVLRIIFLISTLTSLLIIVIMLFLGLKGGSKSGRSCKNNWEKRKCWDISWVR